MSERPANVYTLTCFRCQRLFETKISDEEIARVREPVRTALIETLRHGTSLCLACDPHSN